MPWKNLGSRDEGRKGETDGNTINLEERKQESSGALRAHLSDMELPLRAPGRGGAMREYRMHVAHYKL